MSCIDNVHKVSLTCTVYTVRFKITGMSSILLKIRMMLWFNIKAYIRLDRKKKTTNFSWKYYSLNSITLFKIYMPFCADVQICTIYTVTKFTCVNDKKII